MMMMMMIGGDDDDNNDDNFNDHHNYHDYHEEEKPTLLTSLHLQIGDRGAGTELLLVVRLQHKIMKTLISKKLLLFSVVPFSFV